MLFGEFRESGAAVEEVQLPGKEADEIAELMRCLFACPKVKAIDEENLDLMLEFAGEYEVAELRRRCVEFLEKKIDKTPRGSLDLLDLAALCSKHHLHEHVPKLIQGCAQLPVEETEKYHGIIRVEMLAAIYQAKARKYQSVVNRLPTWRMHTHAGFSDRQAGQKCQTDRCGSKHSSACKKCKKWFCPNHAIGCTTHDAFQKCVSCSAPLKDAKLVTPLPGLDTCSCGYQFAHDLIKDIVQEDT